MSNALRSGINSDLNPSPKGRKTRIKKRQSGRKSETRSPRGQGKNTYGMVGEEQ